LINTDSPHLAAKLQKGPILNLLSDRGGDRYLAITLFRLVCANCPP